MTDVWGAISIPQAVGQPGLPAGDPALFYIVDFLKTFLSTDKNATSQWQIAGVAPYLEPVRTAVVGRPDDGTYRINAAQLPALFIFRGSEPGQIDSWGDDWDIIRDKVKLLWVLPTVRPENAQSQLPFANALVKSVFTGIELGRTPSWVQAGDPEPVAQTQGSLMYTYAAFAHFMMKSWKGTVVHVCDEANRRVWDFPAVEMTFEMIENRVLGTEDTLRYSLNTGATDTVNSAVFVAFQTWAASTFYPGRSFVVPSVPATINGQSASLYYTSSSPATSGVTEPTWPLAAGESVTDGSVVWTCVGPTSYTRWSATTPYELGAFVIPVNANGFYYQAMRAGLSGPTPPTFPTGTGSTVFDGAVIWALVAATST